MIALIDGEITIYIKTNFSIKKLETRKAHHCFPAISLPYLVIKVRTIVGVQYL